MAERMTYNNYLTAFITFRLRRKTDGQLSKEIPRASQRGGLTVVRTTAPPSLAGSAAIGPRSGNQGPRTTASFLPLTIHQTHRSMLLFLYDPSRKNKNPAVWLPNIYLHMQRLYSIYIIIQTCTSVSKHTLYILA